MRATGLTQPQRLWLTLDDVVFLLRQTVFSIRFCVLANFMASYLPMTIPHLWSDTLLRYRIPFAWKVWTSLVTFCYLLKQLDRVYRLGLHRAVRPSRLRWEDQIVLITGGAGGLGQVLCNTIAEKGARVVSVNLEHINSKQHDRVRCYVCDIGDAPAVRGMAEKVRQEIGKPTIIINNAGVVKGKLLLDLTDEDIDSTFRSNIIGSFHILRAFLPDLMRSGSGHIVNVSSVLGLLSAAQSSDYCAAKAALVSLHYSLQRELAGPHRSPAIQTTLVLPAWIRTSLFQSIQFPENLFFRFLAPPLEPEEVVAAIVDALEAQEGQTIRLPFYTQSARVLHEGLGLVPAWLRGIVDSISGQDRAMREYGPKPNAAERLQAEGQGSKREDYAPAFKRGEESADDAR